MPLSLRLGFVLVHSSALDAGIGNRLDEKHECHAIGIGVLLAVFLVFGLEVGRESLLLLILCSLDQNLLLFAVRRLLMSDYSRQERVTRMNLQTLTVTTG